jgi:NAD-dependent SIR2 family protein deacetylase
MDLAQKIRSQRVAAQSAARILRPAVDIHLPIELHPDGEVRNGVIKAAEACHLLLIVGLPLKSGEVYDLIRAIGSEVHQRYGAVIYVDDQPIRGRNTSQCIDFHIQVDIEEFSTRVLAAMDKVSLVFT